MWLGHLGALARAAIVRAGPCVPVIDESWTMEPSKFSVVRAVARRLVPHLIEATLIPTSLVYLGLATVGLRWGLAAALAWSWVAVGRRLIGHEQVPGLVLLTWMGITVRTATFLFNGSAFVFFVQPILGTLLTAMVMLGSIALGRPLIGRFAQDFCPMANELGDRPAVVTLFRRLTYLWAGVNIMIAIVNFTLLATVPVEIFVGTKTVSAWVFSCTGVALTVSAAVGCARREGLRTAVSPTGLLHAYSTA
jgi:intracellular septation protein A